MSFKQSKFLEKKEDVEKDVYELLLSKQYYQAYNLAKKIEAEGTAMLFINMAICLNASKSYEKALFYIEKAFNKIHTFKNIKDINLTNDDLDFIKAENEEKSYLLPINPKFELNSFLFEMRVDFFRLDLYILCEKQKNALEIIDKYKNYNFKSVALAKIELQQR